MNSRDIEEMRWNEWELREVFVAFVRSHRRSPTRGELERLCSERFRGLVG